MRPGVFGGYIWATSKRQAIDIAEKRGIGERVRCERGSRAAPYERASTILKKKRMERRKYELIVLHALCFLGMLALASGVSPIQEVLGDDGFLHDYCHKSSSRADLIEKVEFIERRVPGYWPKRGEGRIHTKLPARIQKKFYR